MSISHSSAGTVGAEALGKALHRFSLDLIAAYKGRRRLHAITLGLAILAVEIGVHALLQFSYGFRVLYVLAVWVAVRLGGRVSGGVLVIATAVSTSFLDARYAPIHPAGGLVEDLLVRSAALGLLMLLFAQVEESLESHRKLALTDPLTGLLNRRALLNAGPELIERAQQDRQPLVVAVIDCNEFKRLNDLYGHEAGDAVLRLLARTLEQGTRATDFVARIGGDEFIVVLQQTDEVEALRIMTRIKEVFEVVVRNAGYDASLSVGYASVEHEPRTLEELISQADKAMYADKQSHRSHAYLN